MKTIFDHIENVKGRPHHVRKRIAFGAAGGIAALIAVVWVGVGLSTNAFAIQGSSFAEASGAETSSVSADTSNNSSELAGAAAALPQNGSEKGPARIQIVDTASSSASSAPTNQTTIPF